MDIASYRRTGAGPLDSHRGNGATGGSGIFLKAIAPNENIQLGLIERFQDERAQEGLPTPTPEESLQISSGQEE